jgi:asparagine synthase (glutamine-hydrolysing)
MCGLLFTDIGNVSETRFLKALDLMHHRGPDAQGFYQNKNLKFGHKRLKILDLNDRSNQPFFSSDHRYVCIFNGEIYNYIELAKKHQIKLETTCDTELLINLYIRLGAGMLSELNGMFAFLIYDIPKKEYFVARDRLGIKPLYILEGSEGIIISSEIAPITMLTGSVEIDEIGERQYRKLRSFFNGRTLYKGISMFPQAHYRMFSSESDTKNTEAKRFWEVDFTCDQHIPNDQVAELIQSSVDYRNISDVSVGTYLSGGLDSTIITGLANQSHSWTVGFDSQNEFDYARLAAKQFKTEHSEIVVDKRMFLSALDEMLAIRREPLSVPNEVLLFLMTKEVKKENTVVLSGEGADELFHGYDRIFRWAAASEWSVEGFDTYYSYGSHEDYEIIEDVMSSYAGYDSTLQKVSAFFQIEHLSGLLRRLDSSTMMASVEGRVPFVDHRLVELLATASYDYRSDSGNVIKDPLKKIYHKLVPPDIIHRPKVGFPVPINTIFNDSTSNPMDSWLNYNLNYVRENVL